MVADGPAASGAPMSTARQVMALLLAAAINAVLWTCVRLALVWW